MGRKWSPFDLVGEHRIAVKLR
jgi:steroid delta-isomerase-like uncharacterized protein